MVQALRLRQQPERLHHNTRASIRGQTRSKGPDFHDQRFERSVTATKRLRGAFPVIGPEPPAPTAAVVAADQAEC